MGFLLFAIVSGAWLAALHLVRSHGVNLTGDEPHYLVEALSIARFHTLNMDPAYNFALSHHIIYPWEGHQGPNLAAAIGQSIHRHGLYLPFHAIGLSLLLSVPMLAGTSTALVTLILVLSGLTVGLVYLTCEASATSSPWRWAIGALFLAPPVCLAATQVYPDFIYGLVMGIIVMSIAVVEFRGRCSWSQIGVVSSLLVVLPWFDQKNVFYPVPLLIAFLVCCARAKVPRKALRWVVAPALLSLAGLLALNVYEFGDLLGGPQQLELFTRNTGVRALALLVDHGQGLFVQLPVVLLGVAGLWTSRRRLPVAVVAGAFVVVTTIYGNATQPGNFGGYSFVGRFQWPTIPVLLAFAGLLLLNMAKLRRVLVATIGTLMGVSYIIQLAPILRNEHVYYNNWSWDPQSYVGWWGAVDPSPILGYIGRYVFSNPRVDLGALCIAVACALVVYLLVELSTRPARLRPLLVGGALIALAAIYPATLSSATLLPTFAEPGVVTALPSVRVCDTRVGNPSNLNGTALQCSHVTVGSPLPVAGGILTFRVTGAFGVPRFGVTAVMLNIVSTHSVSPGSLTIFPTGQPSPPSPSLFYVPGLDSSTFAQVPTGAGGSVSLGATSRTDVVVDLEGYVSTAPAGGAGRYHPVASGTIGCEATPSGDTRAPTNCRHGAGYDALLGTGAPQTIGLTGEGGVPASDATAVLLGLAVTSATGPGSVSAYPAGHQPVTASAINFTTGRLATNQLLVPLGSSGAVTFDASAQVRLVVHVLAYIGGPGVAGGARYTPEIAPVRICDTQGANPSELHPPYTQCNPGTSNGPSNPIAPGGARTIKVAGLGYVPTGARAVALTINALPGTASGYLSIDPGSTYPVPPDIAYTAGVPTISGVVVNLSVHGTIGIANVGRSPTNLVIDVVGWYADSP